jgi:hypothetical protein
MNSIVADHKTHSIFSIVNRNIVCYQQHEDGSLSEAGRVPVPFRNWESPVISEGSATLGFIYTYPKAGVASFRLKQSALRIEPVSSPKCKYGYDRGVLRAD